MPPPRHKPRQARRDQDELDLVMGARFRLWLMRRFRVWMLVLLAVLLPVRGAMAAAMLCAPSTPGVAGQTTLTQDATAHHDSTGHTHHDHAQHEHGSGAHDHHAQASQDKCNLCSATCSLTPLVNHIAGVEVPRDLRTASFPDLAAPPPSFLSDGQERPPRRI